jgi:hypothetical protein
LQLKVNLLINKDNENLIEYYETKIKEIENEYLITLNIFKDKDIQKNTIDKCTGAQGIHKQLINLKFANNNLLTQNQKLCEELSILRKYTRTRNVYKELLYRLENINHKYSFS